MHCARLIMERGSCAHLYLSPHVPKFGTTVKLSPSGQGHEDLEDQVGCTLELLTQYQARIDQVSCYLSYRSQKMT